VRVELSARHAAAAPGRAPSDLSVAIVRAGNADELDGYFIGFGSDATPEDVAHALQEKAAQLGCDAVVRVFIDVGYSRANAAGVCVKYMAPGPEGPTTLPPQPPPNTTPPDMRPAPAPRIEPLPSNNGNPTR
jgi:hypothetical protein